MSVAFMIDDATLTQLLRINDELLQLCKFLNEKRDMETSSRLIPLVDDLTRNSDRSSKKIRLWFLVVRRVTRIANPLVG
jgi:hypothetical protein